VTTKGKLLCLMMITCSVVLAGIGAKVLFSASAGEPGGSSAGKTMTGQTSTLAVRWLNDKGELLPAASVPRAVKTDAEWRKQLTAEQYQIARGRGPNRLSVARSTTTTKPVFTPASAADCRCLPQPQNSIQGQAGRVFFKPVTSENVVTQLDASHGMRRTEILCSLCGAHLGHEFDDGPPPTHLRYCLNSASLVFKELKNPPK